MSNEKHWSEDVARGCLDILKDNTTPFCLCGSMMQEHLQAAAQAGDVDKLSVWGHWESRDILAGDMSPSRTYRLRQDFIRPEKEASNSALWGDLSSEQKEGALKYVHRHSTSGNFTVGYRSPETVRGEEKKGRWEVCEVCAADCGCWKVRRQGGNSKYLSDAPGMVGYGGIEYEEWPGDWCKLGIQKEYSKQCGWIECKGNNGIPATPKKVRFLIKK